MKCLLAVIAVLGILFVSNPVKAEGCRFDDSFDEWWYFTSGTGAALTESGGKLNFTATGATSMAGAGYVLNQPFGFNNDFKVKVQFFNDIGVNSGGVELGLAKADENNQPSLVIYEGANYYNSAKRLEAGVNQLQNEVFLKTYNRDVNSGWLGMEYYANTDLLILSAFVNDPEFSSGNNYLTDPVTGEEMSTEFSGFTTAYNPDKTAMNIYLGGWSHHGAVFNGEAGHTAYFDNFAAVKAVPEPVSTVLFLAGGAVLAGRRFRRKT